ncbi:CsiV family protein [Pseudomonas sp. RL_15y_Pfl2_60]|uniref:CsiV family protein n=1 Tax=Pseudomonas sp. RL_15y_Pfl2_60 TaxID=3088709 RepID=UPI0030D7F3BE
MRALRSLALLPLLALSAFSPTAVAADSYQIEVIVFRQPGEVLISGKRAPDDWRQGARLLEPDQERATALNDEAEKLNDGGDYQVLLHKAWTQSSDETLAFSSGDMQLGHAPIEGTLTLKQDRSLEAKVDLWINQFEPGGLVSRSERLQQSSTLQTHKLNYIDHSNLGMLIRVRPE